MKFFLLLSLVLLLSCQAELDTQTLNSPMYYDLKGFVEQQADLLKTLDPSLSKEVYINEEKKQKTLQNIAWDKELVVFKQADINKSSLTDMYHIDTLIQKPNTVFTYSAKEIDLPVQEIRITYDQQAQIKNIIINIKKSNFLYSSTTQLGFDCQKTLYGNLISDYRYSSTRTMVASSPKKFEIVAHINYE